MVTITGYRTRSGVHGEKKIYFQVEGGVQSAISKTTGKVYLTSMKATVFAAVDEELAREMVGHQIPGSIKQLSVEPYEIVNVQTGEVRVFDHRNELVLVD